MTWLEKIQKKFRRVQGVPHLMWFVTGLMLMAAMLDLISPEPNAFLSMMTFDRSLILSGEVWRIVTFLFIPPSNSVLFLVIALYFNVFLGDLLEEKWGSGIFTLYYGIGVLGAIIAGMIEGEGSNAFISTSMFLAIACLYPDLEIRLFFILPVKIKWIGIVDAVLYVLVAIFSILTWSWEILAALIASLINFLIFFGPSFIDMWKTRRRIQKRRSRYNDDKR